MKKVFAILLMLLIAISTAVGTQESLRVSFNATDEGVNSIVEELCKNYPVKILVEKSADVKISANVTDLPIEDALTMIAKAGDLAWRKVYIRVDSPLLKNPDMLASTIRLLESLQFPNILLEGSPTTQSLVYIANKAAVDAIPLSMRKDLGMLPVYLISNDKAAKEAKAKADTKLARYMELQKEAAKLFMEMTPEEREQAMASGVQILQQLDPNYILEASRSLLKNPAMLEQIMQTRAQAMFSLPPEERRALMRMQMQAMRYLTPEQIKILQEDAMELMKEMGAQGSQVPGQ